MRANATLAPEKPMAVPGRPSRHFSGAAKGEPQEGKGLSILQTSPTIDASATRTI